MKAYQMKLIVVNGPKKAEIESIDFQLARKLANKALLYIKGLETKDSVQFSRKAYEIISKL